MTRGGDEGRLAAASQSLIADSAATNDVTAVAGCDPLEPRTQGILSHRLVRNRYKTRTEVGKAPH